MQHFLSPKLSDEIDVKAFRDTRKNDLEYYKPYIKEFEMLSNDIFENENIFTKSNKKTVEKLEYKNKFVPKNIINYFVKNQKKINPSILNQLAPEI